VDEVNMTSVAFFGLGRMGRPIARHLVTAGHHVIGLDPSSHARDHAREVGVEVVDALPEPPPKVVISSLPDTPQVEEVYLGGLLEKLERGSLLLDLSTIDVSASRQIAKTAKLHGHHFLDCPLSGTSVHAEAGSLAVMVGGEPEDVELAQPFLATFSTSVHHVGSSGAGLEMKLITNRLLTAHLVSLAEAILEMEEAGLDPNSCIELLRQGAVPKLLDYKAIPMANRDHSPLFTVDLMAKDLRLADARRSAGAVIDAAAKVMSDAKAAGWGPMDISAVIEVIGDVTPAD
jgi:2-hydroxy-3-oxopropionate reductase